MQNKLNRIQGKGQCRDKWDLAETSPVLSFEINSWLKLPTKFYNK